MTKNILLLVGLEFDSPREFQDFMDSNEKTKGRLFGYKILEDEKT